MKNGRKTKLTNENKYQYVKLMLKRTFIGRNEKLFKLILNGFNELVIDRSLEEFDSTKLRSEINGDDFIDLDDWYKHTTVELYDEHSSIDAQILGRFFNIISYWPEENLRKLLKFVTGSSQVPINGFKDLKGGYFHIKLNRNHNMYPEAHTYFNAIVLPSSNSNYELEKKLLVAIEIVDFDLQ